MFIKSFVKYTALKNACVFEMKCERSISQKGGSVLDDEVSRPTKVMNVVGTGESVLVVIFLSINEDNPQL